MAKRTDNARVFVKIFSILMLVSNLHGEEPNEEKFSVGVYVGYSSSDSHEGGTVDTHVNHAVAFGYQVSPNLRLELEQSFPIGARSTIEFRDNDSEIEGFTTEFEGGRFLSVNLIATVPPESRRILPFVGVGLGVLREQAFIESEFLESTSDDVIRIEGESKSQNNFGFELTTGAEVPITKVFSMGAALRYTKVESERTTAGVVFRWRF